MNIEFVPIDLVIGIIVTIAVAYIGWSSRKVTHAPEITNDPILFILIASTVSGVILLYNLIELPIIKVGIIAVTSLVVYIIGFTMSTPPSKVTLSERDRETGGLRYFTIQTYKKGGKQYIVDSTLSGVIKALLGRSDEAVINLALPHYTIPVEFDDCILEEVIPLKSVTPKELGKGRIQYTYTFADRMHLRPEAFYFEMSTYDDMLKDNSELNAKLTEMDVKYQSARTEGVVDLVHDMQSFSPKNKDILDKLKELVDEEITQILKEVKDGDESVPDKIPGQ